MSQATLADVARAAGVSLATASRALHGASGRRVGDELRERVRAAAAALDYSPNAAAQAMARGTTGVVGLVVHDIADPFAASFAAGVMAEAAQRDLIVTIAASRWDPATELRQVEALRRQRARAVLLAGSRSADADADRRLAAELAGIAAAGGHVAVVGNPGLGVPTVELDDAGGARRLARTLWALGYRSFAVLAGPERVPVSRARLGGFRSGVTAAGGHLPHRNVVATQMSRDGGYVAMAELLDAGLDVDLVFAVTDVMAVGAAAALRERGYRVPEDVALAGFEGTALDVQPPLTTVRLPIAEVGAAVLALAVDGTEVPAVHGEVVVRASTPGLPRPDGPDRGRTPT